MRPHLLHLPSMPSRWDMPRAQVPATLAGIEPELADQGTATGTCEEPE